MPPFLCHSLRRLALLGSVAFVLAGCSTQDDDERRAASRNLPNVDKPTIVVAGIQETATPGTDCALPAESQVVDIFGVPKDDYIQVRILFPEIWGSTKQFGVEVEHSNIARSSTSATGEHEKVMLTIRKGERLSSDFYIQGKQVDKTRLILDKVVDDRETYDTTKDDLTYDENFVSIIVWDFSVDDIVDYNALGGDEAQRCYVSEPNSTTLKADPATRVNCGAKAASIAADGVSHQLLRLRAGGYGRACFTIIDKQDFTDRTAEQYYGSMSDPLAGNPGQAPATNVETSFEYPQPEMYWALGTYTPPTDFYDSAETERKVKIEVQFMPLDENGLPVRSHITAKKRDLEITIKRPPVLLVHGIWSSSETWGDGFRHPEPKDGWFVDDSYSYPNSAPHSTAESADHLRLEIENHLGDARSDDKMSATKVDLIAHSMGGLKTRRWLHAGSYRAPENFHDGNVRKFVTVTTPHLGSPLANMLINLHDEFSLPGEREVHANLRLGILEAALGDFHGGAVCELADNNPALVFPSLSGVRNIAYTASGGPQNRWALLIDVALRATLCDTANLIECVLNPELKVAQADPYLFNAPNDKIVDVASQSAGPLVAGDFPDYSHLDLPLTPDGVTSEPLVAAAIYARLDTDSEFDGWSRNMAPVSVGILGVAPRRGGRGLEIDSQNYRNQCTGDGPMYP